MLDQTDSGGPDAGASRGGSALRDALRRARVEAAEQTDVVVDLRHAEIARLELLRDALTPMLAEIPPEIDLFDVGLVPGDRPRLFVDMVSFVEMGRDRRLYRFMRDSRHGRVCAAESEQTGPIVDAITDYVARRLVERERLLADDDRISFAQPRHAEAPSASAPQPAAAEAPPTSAVRTYAPKAHIAETQGSDIPAPVAEKPRRSGWKRAIAILAAFGVGGALGAVVVAVFLFAAAKGLLPF